MTVTINGERAELASGTTVIQVVARYTDHGAGVAVAVNDTVVPRGAWSRTAVEPGDRLEVLTAVQGG